MHIFLALIISFFSFMPIVPDMDSGQIDIPRGGIDAPPTQEWAAVGFLWDCVNEERCPGGNSSCPHCPDKR